VTPDWRPWAARVGAAALELGRCVRDVVRSVLGLGRALLHRPRTPIACIAPAPAPPSESTSSAAAAEHEAHVRALEARCVLGRELPPRRTGDLPMLVEVAGREAVIEAAAVALVELLAQEQVELDPVRWALAGLNRPRTGAPS